MRVRRKSSWQGLRSWRPCDGISFRDLIPGMHTHKHETCTQTYTRMHAHEIYTRTHMKYTRIHTVCVCVCVAHTRGRAQVQILTHMAWPCCIPTSHIFPFPFFCASYLRETDKNANRLDLAPEVHEVIRLVKNLRPTIPAPSSTSSTGYKAASGLDAIRSFKSLGESVLASSDDDDVSVGKAGGTEGGDLDDMPAFVQAKIAEERAVVEQARRDQRWLDREMARETNVEEAWMKKQDAEKDAFLAWIDTVNPPDPEPAATEPAAPGAAEKITK